MSRIAGYMGITLEGEGSTDANGNVSYVHFSIDYDTLTSKVNIEVSDKANAFAALMCDGSTIILSNPKVISKNIGNAVIQFKLARVYPSNSPCTLVYNTNQAYINITESN